MEEIKCCGKPMQGTEVRGIEQVSVSSRIFWLGRRPHGDVHPPRQSKLAAQLGASCWPSRRVMSTAPGARSGTSPGVLKKGKQRGVEGRIKK